MKISLLQMRVEEDPFKNLEKVVTLTESIKDSIVILPELWTTGFNYEHIEKMPHNHHQIIANLPEGNTYVGSIVRYQDGKRYNSFFVKNDKGYDFPYDKTHLFPLMDEDKHFSAGKNLSAFRLNGAVCGCAICFDLRYPEIFRIYFKSGVEVVFLPAQWPDSRKNHLVTLATARAIENQSYFIYSNAVGKIWGEEFAGESRVISPTGETVLSMGKTIDEISTIDIDLNIVKDFRSRIPIKSYLRPDIYGQ
ncbi:nitrilase-related carbon-nitrogen hydrolase [Calditerrivibrio nitroreducens]